MVLFTTVHWFSSGVSVTMVLFTTVHWFSSGVLMTMVLFTTVHWFSSGVLVTMVLDGRPSSVVLHDLFVLVPVLSGHNLSSPYH